MPDETPPGTVFVLGGARSGKSAFAEGLARQSGLERHYVATARAFDDEMRARIARHKKDRGGDWATQDCPLSLTETLRAMLSPKRVVLVDCLTLWLSNLMLAEQDWQGEAEALAAILPEQRAPVVFVTNEVGAGIVPENALARAFRDAAGLVNQTIAAASDELWLSVAGYPLKVK